MKESKLSRNDIIKCTVIIVSAVLIIAVMFTLFYIFELRDDQPDDSTDDSPDDIPSIEYNGQKYLLRSDVETVLVMGLDKYEDKIDNSTYYNDQCADFMMLVIFDHGNKTISAIHINRDTMAEMSVLGKDGQEIGRLTQQITLAHSYGSGLADSCENTANAVSELLCGVPIDHYVQFAMDAIYAVNDFVGGVEVTVLHDGLTSYDTALVKGATVRLNASQAENYVRHRWYIEGDSNIARMERQRQYLMALYEQVKTISAENANFSVEAYEQMERYMYTDCTDARLEYYFNISKEYEIKDIHTYDGELTQNTEKGWMEYKADVADIKRIVVSLMYALENKND